MEQADFIRDIIGRLNKLSLTYCITGSIASNFFGLPRLTHDLDIVIFLNMQNVQALIKEFSPDCYIDEESIKEAIRNKGMFNVIHHQTGLKIDFWMLKDDEFNRNLFIRRQQMEILTGVFAWLATAEDVLLSKLLWYRMTPSDRQLNDAKGILEVQGERLDMNYIKEWTKRLDIDTLLKQVIKSSPPNQY